MKRLAVLAVLATFAAGCGSSPSDEDRVRDTVRQRLADAHAHKWGDYCAATTKPKACSEAVASSMALGVDPAELVPSDRLIDNMRITVNGSRATVDATAAKDAEYVRRGDEWLSVWQD